MTYCWIKHREILAIIIFLIFLATYASLQGFISPDSWYYINLTQSILDGNQCEIDGKYYATYPCGYPTLLALMSFSNDPVHIIVISKFVNALLLFLSFLFFRKLLSQSQFLAALIIIAPSTINIFLFTWSENLFLFATAATLFQVHKLSLNNSYINQLILLAVLLIGISARYFFGPFAALIWLSSLAIYGHKAAMRILPVFVTAGFIFLGYYFLNIELTGYGTGQERIPAPESIKFLIAYFFRMLLIYEIPKFSLVLILFYFATRNILRLVRPSLTLLKSKKGELLLLLSGLSFLVLSFAMRAIAQFDLFGFRTIGYGLTFTLVGIYALLTESKKMAQHSFLSIIAIAIISFSIAQGSVLKDIAHSFINKTYSYQSISKQINEYKKLSDIKGYDNVVSFGLPRISKTISSNHRLYYDKKTNVIVPAIAPYDMPEDLESFLQRLHLLKGRCIVDFKTFSNKDEFIEALHQKVKVDFIYDYSSKKFRFIQMRRYEENLANFLIDNYDRQTFISCSKLLK